ETLVCQRFGALLALPHGRSRVDDVGLGISRMSVDGGGKRGQNSGGLVTFHSAPFPLGRGCSLRTARSGQGRAGVARRSEPFTARTVLRSSTRGKGVALNGPLKWPSRSQPLTLDWARDHLSYTKSLPPVA